MKYCRASAFKKMIMLIPGQQDHEKCSSPQYINCSIVSQQGEQLPPGLPACPFLRESPAQYCSAVPVTKYVPCSEAPFSRCDNENHYYCEHYLEHAGFEQGTPAVKVLARAHQRRAAERIYCVEGIRIPGWLDYSANHMWLDKSGDGCCHVGVNGFLTRVLGAVESISFLSAGGTHNPTAVLTAAGVDLQIVFPNRMRITGTNAFLRANPDKLTLDPYSWGWFFEGRAPETSPPEALRGGLIHGKAAQKWMTQELRRISEFLCRHCGHDWHQNGRYSHEVCSELPRKLTREQTLCLYNEFFAPHANWESRKMRN